MGLALATVALFEGIWGTDPIYTAKPEWLAQTTEILGAKIPNLGHKSWRWFYTQQHGDNPTYEVILSATR